MPETVHIRMAVELKKRFAAKAEVVKITQGELFGEMLDAHDALTKKTNGYTSKDALKEIEGVHKKYVGKRKGGV